MSIVTSKTKSVINKKMNVSSILLRLGALQTSCIGIHAEWI
jgi:hypothetical protein